MAAAGKAKHTPGPWYASGDEVLIDMGDRSHLLATAADWSEDTEANACLIAAAPDLLEALQGWLPIAERQLERFVADYPQTAESSAYEYAVKRIEASRAAIAKATGEA